MLLSNLVTLTEPLSRPKAAVMVKMASLHLPQPRVSAIRTDDKIRFSDSDTGLHWYGCADSGLAPLAPPPPALVRYKCLLLILPY